MKILDRSLRLEPLERIYELWRRWIPNHRLMRKEESNPTHREEREKRKKRKMIGTMVLVGFRMQLWPCDEGKKANHISFVSLVFSHTPPHYKGVCLILPHKRDFWIPLVTGSCLILMIVSWNIRRTQSWSFPLPRIRSTANAILLLVVQ